ncbi:cupredoxin domain-containing protein [Falsigemmobacter faecalis]|nr:hypothetical protein [Falsigemmobacter faecalis]
MGGSSGGAAIWQPPPPDLLRRDVTKLPKGEWPDAASNPRMRYKAA